MTEMMTLSRYPEIQAVLAMGAMPCPMRYQPLDATDKNTYVAPGWSEAELRRMARYFWKYRFLKYTPYEEFRLPDESAPLFEEAKK